MKDITALNYNNFLPRNSSIDYIIVEDGTQLRWGLFPATVEKKATILLLNGHRDFIEKQTELIEYLQGIGFDVYSYDHRGQGGSDRSLSNNKKSHNPNFGRIVKDIHEIVERLIIPKKLKEPLYLCSHSLGTHVAIRYLHDYPNVFKKAVLMAPFTNFYIRNKTKSFFMKIYTYLANIFGFSNFYATGQARHSGVINHDYAFSRLTHDRARYDWAQHVLSEKPELFVGGVTFGWLKGAMKSIKLLKSANYLSSIKTPLLVLLAGEEYVVDNNRTFQIFDGMQNATLKIIKGARHELYLETDEFRDEVLEELNNHLTET